MSNPKEVQSVGASDTLEAVAFPETATCKAVSEHRFCSQRGEMNCFARGGFVFVGLLAPAVVGFVER